MEGLKTYRHETNPLEKDIHDFFVDKFVNHPSGVALELISMPTDGSGDPKDFLSDREKQIMITTIQWLGSSIGQGFLNGCGFGLPFVK